MEVSQDIKICSGCKKPLPINQFNKDKRRKSGLRAKCRQCESEWQKQHRIRIPDYRKSYNLEYYQSNRNKWSIYNHNRYEQHKDEIKQYIRIHYQTHKQEVYERKKRYKDSHRGLYRISWLKRRAIMLGCDGSFSVDEWENLCAKYDHRCLMCGCIGVKLTVDHVIPLSVGGSNYITNIQPLCQSCNSRKGASMIDLR